MVADGGGGGYFVEKLGKEYQHHGGVFGCYDLEMSRLLLRSSRCSGLESAWGAATSGDSSRGNDSIMHLNYPPYQRPYEMLGTDAWPPAGPRRPAAHGLMAVWTGRCRSASWHYYKNDL